MDNKAINRIASDVKLEISHQIDKFVSNLQRDTNDVDDFTTITQLEEKLSPLRSNTAKTYSDILSVYLSSQGVGFDPYGISVNPILSKYHLKISIDKKI